LISFDPLWVTLKTKGLNKGELQKLTGFSSSTIAKLSKNEVVKLDIVERICEKLDVPIEDVVEIRKS
jgi:DNA-binding Xre family transcriptional regulator